MKKYDSLNGVRAIACIGIVLMHILANTNYIINASISNIISKCTNFVFLFMVLSSFSMCCGYYEKIKNNKISPEDFYKRRITKTLPFFLLLIILDVIIEHNKVSIIEGFADSTLLFGFLQKNMSVIGVGWFIGLVFIFYLMFPFFVYLFSNTKRAWLTTITALIMNISCIYYFGVGRTNMFYSFLFFCVGGLLYLYKEKIIDIFNKNRIIGLIALIASIAFYFTTYKSEYLLIAQVIFSIFTISYAISFSNSLLNTKATKFIGEISLEIYLSHMLIFRALEKIQFANAINNDYLSYIIISIFVLLGTIIVSKLYKFGTDVIKKKVIKNENTAN